MGILTRRQGADFVISSDRNSTDAPTNRAPKGRSTDHLSVWTGDAWSAQTNEALTFATLEDADEYVRANFSKVTAQLAVVKTRSVRPAQPSTIQSGAAEPIAAQPIAVQPIAAQSLAMNSTPVPA